MQAQCWICPKCHDDHNRKRPCDTEDGAFELLMLVVQLAKAEKPYKIELGWLTAVLPKYPKVQALTNQLVNNLRR